MSLEVPLAELAAELERYGPAAYLLTVRDDARVHLVHTDIRHDGTCLRGEIGRSSAVNIAVHPTVTLLWPPFEPGELSLLVDGRARVEDDGSVAVTPTWAVRHRPAASQRR